MLSQRLHLKFLIVDSFIGLKMNYLLISGLVRYTVHYHHLDQPLGTNDFNTGSEPGENIVVVPRMGLFLWSDAEHLSGHAVFGSSQG